MRRWLPVFLLASFCLGCFGLPAIAAGKVSWSIHVNVPEFHLRLYRNGEVYRQFTLAVGKPSTPTPVGLFSIKNRVKNPTWWPTDGRPPVPPGPRNPLGPWWMGITMRVGIHGGGKADTVGKAITHGCMRMLDKDVSEVAKWVAVGVPVSITYKLFQPLPSADGWKVQVFANIYGRPFPAADEVSQLFREQGFEGQTDWDLVAALLRSPKSKPQWVPLRKTLMIGSRRYECLSTPEQTWIPIEVAEGLIWLCAVGDFQYWRSFGTDLRKISVGTGDKRFVTLDALKGLVLSRKILVQQTPEGTMISWLPAAGSGGDTGDDPGGGSPGESAP